MNFLIEDYVNKKEANKKGINNKKKMRIVWIKHLKKNKIIRVGLKKGMKKGKQKLNNTIKKIGK